jgi:nucleoside-diphosphate-sugar epimerase
LARGFESVEMLEESLSRPTPGVVRTLSSLAGDLLILGVGGKMGPTLAFMARRAVVEGGLDKQVIGVARFTEPMVQDKLEAAGVETIRADLMREGALEALPAAPNVIYMVGSKFGTTGQEARTWAINAYLPGKVASRFKGSRIVVFSSGNVYPLAPVGGGGCTEDTPPAPVGEYAQSVLGRERIFEYFARQHDVSGVLFRLNYAVEMRYGVLLDVARKVWIGEPIDLSMGYANVIWQGDANAYALCALGLVESPPRVLNVTGPETVSIRWLAERFGEMLDRRPAFVGTERENALLSNAGLAFRLLGYPSVSLGQVIEWVAAWVIDGGPVLDKPTHFEVRDGRF